MLVLSRRIGDQVCIGDGIVVTIVAIRGGLVRLGFDAPQDVRVDRREVRARRAKSISPAPGAMAAGPSRTS